MSFKHLFFFFSVFILLHHCGSILGQKNVVVKKKTNAGAPLGFGNYLENSVPCLDKSIRYRKRPMSQVRVRTQVAMIAVFSLSSIDMDLTADLYLYQGWRDSRYLFHVHCWCLLHFVVSEYTIYLRNIKDSMMVQSRLALFCFILEESEFVYILMIFEAVLRLHF